MEGPDFRYATTGGPLLSFLTLLLLPAVINCEALEFSMCTYNNKRYGASVDLNLDRVHTDRMYNEDVFTQLKKDTVFTSVWYIPRFLAMMAELNFLEHSHTKCHFGKSQCGIP